MEHREEETAACRYISHRAIILTVYGELMPITPHALRTIAPREGADPPSRWKNRTLALGAAKNGMRLGKRPATICVLTPDHI